MPENPKSAVPVGRGGLARRKAIDKVVDEAVSGSKPSKKPPYTRTPTPERNSTYDDMEKRIYGDKSAKAK
jgi:hypothetical protein